LKKRAGEAHKKYGDLIPQSGISNLAAGSAITNGSEGSKDAKAQAEERLREMMKQASTDEKAAGEKAEEQA
jgi:hypothetical protein